MTGVYICRCGHPKSQHRREQHGCRALDCGCGQFEADLRASAVAQGVTLTTGSPVTEPAAVDLADCVPFAAAGAVPTSELGLGPTSAQLRNAQVENERLRAEAQETEQAFSLVRAELESARRELGDLRHHQETRARVLRERDAELERLRALIARVEQAAGIDPQEDRGVDLADRVQAIRDGRTEAIDALVQVAGERNVLALHQRYLCETCGARYGQPYTDHPCGRLTPVTVTITRGATTA